MSTQPNENHPPSERKSNHAPKREESLSWDQEKPLLEHLDDFRATFMKCLASLVLGCIGVAIFFAFFAHLLKAPLEWALEGNEELMQGLVTTSPMGVFPVLIQVCLMGGLALAIPFMLYHIAMFVAPALTPAERRVLAPSCIVAFLLFVVGAAFSYFFVLPASLSVAIELNKILGYQLIWSAPHYYGLVVWMTLGIGLCFEFPVILVVLQYLGIIPTEKLRNARRYMAVIIFVIAAMIIPGGDPISLMIMVVPLYLLYEFSMIVGAHLTKKRYQNMPTDDILD